MTESQLIKEFNCICNKHRSNNSTLADLSDHELLIWITGKTFSFGRSVNDSIENAELHMKNRKEAEKLFSVKRTDLLGL